MNKESIENAVDGIVNDLFNRRWLRHAWAQFNEPTKREIKKGWQEIIRREQTLGIAKETRVVNEDLFK